MPVVIRKPCRAAEPRRGAGTVALLIATFAVMALVTRLFCTDLEGYASFWPANAAMLVAFLTLRLPLAFLAVLGCVIVNYFVNMLSPISPSEALLTCALNVFHASVAALLARRFCGALTDLSRASRMVTFAACAAVASLLEASAGVFFEVTVLHDSVLPFANWLQWVMCDTLGLMIGTPACLRIVRRAGWRKPEDRRRDRLVLAMVVVVCLLTVYSFLLRDTPLFLLLYPPLALVALTGRSGLALCAIYGVALIATALTTAGFGPVTLVPSDVALDREKGLQIFLLSLYLVVMPITHVVGERRRDMHRIVLMRARFQHAATHDPLTGLMNRARFDRLLNVCLERGTAAAVLLIDLDHFKLVNDDFGHQAGDMVLRLCAERMSAAIADPLASLARIGGDEFAVILPDVSSTETLVARCEAIFWRMRA